MVKETARKCSNCGHSGHNSRTCNGKGCVKLFGVNLMDNSIKNRCSKRNIQSLTENSIAVVPGYHSHNSQMVSREVQSERKKGKAWTVEEHQYFLAGLEKLGKGKWSGISKHFVKTRTSTQVASHAQKYYQRLQASDDMKKRISIFDNPLDQAAQALQDSPVVTPVEIAKTSPEARSSSDSTSNNAVVCFDDSTIIPLSIAYPPNYREIQQMSGAPGNCNWKSSLETKMMPSPSFIPYMMPGYGPYGYMPHTFGNFPSCALVTAHPSSIPSP